MLGWSSDGVDVGGKVEGLALRVILGANPKSRTGNIASMHVGVGLRYLFLRCILPLGEWGISNDEK